jgi:hypothetical protein
MMKQIGIDYACGKLDKLELKPTKKRLLQELKKGLPPKAKGATAAKKRPAAAAAGAAMKRPAASGACAPQRSDSQAVESEKEAAQEFLGKGSEELQKKPAASELEADHGLASAAGEDAEEEEVIEEDEVSEGESAEGDKAVFVHRSDPAQPIQKTHKCMLWRADLVNMLW